MNNIYRKQNEPHLLKCIAAQREEYSRAKKASNCKIFITVLFAILSVVASWMDNDTLTAIVFLLAGIVSLFSKYIDINTYEYKNTAALTQQYIDVTLYNFVLKDDIDSWGSLPTASQLAETISKISESDTLSVKNWYSDYSSLNPTEQIFLCQQENIRWDIKLRQEFKFLILVLTCMVLIGLSITTVLVNPSIIKLLCVISWMLPLIDFCYYNFSRLQKDIDRLNKLREKCNEIDKMISKKDFTKTEPIRLCLIDLQNGIMENRKNSTMLPNWFYNIRQHHYQNNEDQIAEEVQNIVCGSDNNEYNC